MREIVVVLMLGALVAVPSASADHDSGCSPDRGEVATVAGHHVAVQQDVSVEQDMYQAYPTVSASASAGLYEESNGVPGYQGGDEADCGHGEDDPVVALECDQSGLYVFTGACGVDGAALP